MYNNNNYNNFEALDMLNIISYIAQMQNMQKDTELNKYIHEQVETMESKLDIIIEQNKQILQRLGDKE